MDVRRLLTLGEVAAFLGWPKEKFRSYHRRHVGPRYLRPSPKCVLFREEDVIAWRNGRSPSLPRR